MATNELTIKQEAFCQAFVQNKGNASEAYRAAYAVKNMKANAIGVEACRLLADPRISLRVHNIRSDIAKRHELTVDSIIAELEEARELARSASNPNTSVMVAASMGKAKVAGLIKDKQEITGADGGPLDVSLKVSFV